MIYVPLKFDLLIWLSCLPINQFGLLMIFVSTMALRGKALVLHRRGVDPTGSAPCHFLLLFFFLFASGQNFTRDGIHVRCVRFSSANISKAINCWILKKEDIIIYRASHVPYWSRFYGYAICNPFCLIIFGRPFLNTAWQIFIAWRRLYLPSLRRRKFCCGRILCRSVPTRCETLLCRNLAPNWFTWPSL